MGSVFLQAEDLPTTTPRFLMRSTKKLVTERGGSYIGISVNSKKPFLILGTRETPVVTPTGVKKIDSPNGSWQNLSVALEPALEQAVAKVDEAILDTLSGASEMLFGMAITPTQLLKLKYYTPIIYKKEDSDLAPLLSGKVPDDCQVVGLDNLLVPKNVAILPGAKIRVIFSVGSLFFKSDNQCRLTVKVSKIQLLEQGEDESEADNYLFD